MNEFFFATLQKWIYNFKYFLPKNSEKILHPISLLLLFKTKKKNKKNKKKEKTRTEPFQKGSNYKCGECFPNTCYPSGFSIAETQ